MQIFNDKKQRVGILKGFKDRKIVKTLDSGDRELSFKYPSDGEMVDRLKEEYYIRTKDDEYVIRKKKTGVQFNEYTAQLNVEELEGAVFPYGFESKEQTIRACLEFAFEGTGWKVGVCQITKKRTINKDEETNAWKILQDCLSTYRTECKINSLTKTIDIYEQIGSDRGRYFIEGLNLKKLTVTSDTYDFYTRLIPLGKDGIGIEWLGKPYLENYQYSSKIKTYVWSDERYTNTTSLIEDGIAKLDEMSKPYVAYTADVIDLARQSEKYSSVFDFDIGDTVWMISKKTRTKEKQRIVKLTEYPEAPRSNTVELSNATKTFAEVQQEATDQAKSEAIKIANSSAKKVLEDGYYTKTEVETHITASKEEIELGVSKVYETKTIVEEKIKSANELTDEKLKEYSTTEQMNAAINLKAEEIDLEVSKVYETKTSVTEKIKSVNDLTDEKLTLYSTTEEMNAAIKVQAEAIDLSVSKTYETKTTVTEKIKSANELAQSAADTAEENANDETDKKLKEYSTTEEMNAAIKLQADSITTEVNKKVNNSEFGTKITQNAYNVRVAWNNNSKYIQLEYGQLAIYNGDVTAAEKRAVFDEQGNHFYRDGYYVGKIGTNEWSGNNAHKGLVFDLDYQGKYMAFAQKKSQGAGSYTTMLCFSRAGSIYDQYGIHLGCDFYGHWFDMYNVDLHDVNINGYGVADGKSIPIVTEIHDNGNGTVGWTTSSINVRGGMITAVPQGSANI
jgi:phage minor structural protein|uniref:Tail protein n=1 Tax=Myoviridae sp. ctu6J18 TaxID=2827714 RepID=A0A8S5TMX1_9CAUD|nr:MAG TPA: tail protein [Myoviridae sp. ctu6J18]